ncbi:hypothetical protein [Amycolatopsis sp. NPDC059021]|uniref:hypothetical protein n=1 Tax=Amycolatopsis sp. NPDC059021 TaxID=3346704 RepID=UPI00366ED0D6
MSAVARTRRTGPRRLAVLTAATALGLSTIAVAPASADEVEFPVSYQVSGSTTVKKTGSTMRLGPGSLDGALIVNTDTNAVSLKANLKLPDAQADISLLAGLFRVKAKVRITPTGPVTGTLADGTLTTHATANMEISNIWAGPIVPIFPLPTVPGSCKTVKPIEMNLTAKNVDIFNPPIKVSGSYTIPEFTNCFIADVALGAMVSGPDNALTLEMNAAS